MLDPDPVHLILCCQLNVLSSTLLERVDERMDGKREGSRERLFKTASICQLSRVIDRGMMAEGGMNGERDDRRGVIYLRGQAR